MAVVLWELAQTTLLDCNFDILNELFPIDRKGFSLQIRLGTNCLRQVQ